MRELTRYEAFDGKIFDLKEDCEVYEREHPFLNPNEIKFYSINGKKIKGPCESVFLDSNRFVVFSAKTFENYQTYCRHIGLRVPPEPSHLIPFPHHYLFINNHWECLEDKIFDYQLEIENGFLDEYEDNEEDRHNLVDKGIPIGEVYSQ